MERGFLGISSKEPSPSASAKDGSDAAFLRGPAIQWPYASKASLPKPFMSFNTLHDEKSAKLVHQLPSSVYQPVSNVNVFEANQKPSPALAAQKSVSLEKPVGQQHATYVNQSQSNVSFGASTLHTNGVRMHPMIPHRPIPCAMNSSFLNVHGSLNAAGMFAPRSTSEPFHATAQLTIFYSGSVNVFDNVTLDKAQEIMLLAAKASKASAPAVCPPPQSRSPVKTMTKVSSSDFLSLKQPSIQKQASVVPRSSSNKNSVPATSQIGPLYVSTSSTNNDPAVPKTAVPSPPKEQQALPKTSAAATAAPGAIPQYRKASLARFLEKRKERVTNTAPYSSATKSSNNSSGAASGAAPTVS